MTSRLRLQPADSSSEIDNSREVSRLNSQVAALLKEKREMEEKYSTENKKLRADLKIEKEKTEKMREANRLRDEEEALKNENTMNCYSCYNRAKENTMKICTSCALKTENIKVKKGGKIEEKEGFEVNKLAICSTCVMNNHVGEDHKIIKFYPVLAKTKSDKYLSTFVRLRKKMEEMKRDLKMSKNALFNNLDTIDAEFQSMFDMVKRSKSSEAAKQLIDAVANRYEKIQTTNESIKASVEAYTAASNEDIESFKDENKKLDEELCLKEIGKDDWELNISKTVIEEDEDDEELKNPQVDVVFLNSSDSDSGSHHPNQ